MPDTKSGTTDLDPKYDHYDYPTVAAAPQTGHAGFTTPEQNAQVFQLRAMLEQAGCTERLDTLRLVCMLCRVIHRVSVILHMRTAALGVGEAAWNRLLRNIEADTDNGAFSYASSGPESSTRSYLRRCMCLFRYVERVTKVNHQVPRLREVAQGLWRRHSDAQL